MPEPAPAAQPLTAHASVDVPGNVRWTFDPHAGRTAPDGTWPAHLLGHPVARWLDDDAYWRESILHPLDRDRVASLRADRAGGHPYDRTYRVRRADGGEAWVREAAEPAGGAGGSLRGSLVDVTREREAEARAARLAAALELSEEGWITLDAAGRVADANAAAARLLGRERASLLGAPWPGVAETEAGRGAPAGTAAGDGAGPLTIDAHPVPDGVVLRLRPRAGAAGVPEGEGRRLLDALPDAVYCAGSDLAVTFANRAAEDLLGLAAGARLGSGGGASAAHAAAATERVFATGRVSVDPEEPVRAGDGALHYVHTTRVPLREGRAVVGVLCVARDVTAEREARTLAERDRTHLRLALEAGRMGTWEWDIVTGAVTWSPQEERLYGLEPGTFEGTTAAYAARVHPEDREDAWRRVEEALAARSETHHVLHRVLRPDGALRWLDSHGRFLYAADGTPLRLVGLSTDVTEARAAAVAVEAREREFRTLADMIPQLAWMADGEGGVYWFNHRWEEFAGRASADLRAEGWTGAVHPEHRARVEEGLASALRDGGGWEDSFPLRRADGVDRWFLARALPVRGDASEVRWLGTFTDITDERQARDALREDAVLVETLQRIGVSLASELDVDRIVQMVTDEATLLTAAQFGAFFYNVTDERGEAYTLYSLSGVPRAAFAGFPMPRNTAVFGPTFRGEGVVRSEDITRDPRYGRSAPHHGMPPGHLPVRSYLAVPVVSHGGEVIGGLFFGHERPGVFTQRHEQLATGIASWAALAMDNARLFQGQRSARAAAEHARADLQRVLEQAPAAISVTHGPDHVIVSQNAISRQMIGGRDLVGQRGIDVFPEIAEQGFVALQDEVYRTGEPYVGREVPVRIDRDGDGVAEEGFFHLVYQPLKDVEGAVYGILTHAVEVTDQVLARREVERRAEELQRLTRALEESNRELDQFAYVTSHDLKAPLRGIASLAQFVEEDLGERLDGESRTHLALLKGRVQRMEALIDGILEFSRAGRVRGRTEEVDTGAVLREVLDLLAPPPGVVHAVTPLPVVRGERIPLHQLLLNLVGNALKHGRADAPRVEVGWTDRGERWELWVADNGPGIDPAYQERIWGIFQTLQPRDLVEGTGIGLSVVRKIAESRGGAAWVESAPGRGATFRVTLPKEPPTPATGEGAREDAG